MCVSLVDRMVARTSYYKQTNSNYENYPNYPTYNNQPLPTGDDCLTEHNRLRYRHNVEPLDYDATVSFIVLFYFFLVK